MPITSLQIDNHTSSSTLQAGCSFRYQTNSVNTIMHQLCMQQMLKQFQQHKSKLHTHTHTHTSLTALCPGLPGWAGTRKVKPIWILLEQETVSGSGISWAICKSAPRSRQITTPAHHHSVFYRPDALPAAQPTASKH